MDIFSFPEDREEPKRELIREYLEAGVPVPEPEPPEEAYSGKFVVRLPKFLHRELALAAKKNSVSLNQYILTILASSTPVPSTRRRGKAV